MYSHSKGQDRQNTQQQLIDQPHGSAFSFGFRNNAEGTSESRREVNL